MRSNCTSDLPPADADLNLPFIETQLAAIADPSKPITQGSFEGVAADDDLMMQWKKVPEPILRLPPASSCLTGWRDPFMFRAGDADNEWLMLIGSGIKGKGGTVLKYTSKDVLSS